MGSWRIVCSPATDPGARPQAPFGDAIAWLPASLQADEPSGRRRSEPIQESNRCPVSLSHCLLGQHPNPSAASASVGTVASRAPHRDRPRPPLPTRLFLRPPLRRLRLSNTKAFGVAAGRYRITPAWSSACVSAAAARVEAAAWPILSARPGRTPTRTKKRNGGRYQTHTVAIYERVALTGHGCVHKYIPRRVSIRFKSLTHTQQTSSFTERAISPAACAGTWLPQAWGSSRGYRSATRRSPRAPTCPTRA